MFVHLLVWTIAGHLDWKLSPDWHVKCFLHGVWGSTVYEFDLAGILDNDCQSQHPIRYFSTLKKKYLGLNLRTAYTFSTHFYYTVLTWAYFNACFSCINGMVKVFTQKQKSKMLYFTSFKITFILASGNRLKNTFLD